jgi:hypothetical protein
MFAFLAPLLGKFTASAIGKAAIGGVVSAVAGNIGRKTTNPSIDFQAMRDDAQRAGFNPLTVLRSGGMSGYMIPAMSKQSFAGQMLGGAMTGAFDVWANKDIDAYNAEVRRLDIEQRKADLEMTGIMSRNAFSSPTPLAQDRALVESDGLPLTDQDGNVIYYPSTGSEVIPKYRLVYDQSTGGTYAIINPELTESGLSEMATGLAMDAAGQTAAITGTGLSYGGFGFATDPYGFHGGFRSVSGSNMSIARPTLSFGN